MNFLAREPLANGLVLTFFDHSNRYYGNFYRVVVEVQIGLELTPGLFAGTNDPSQAMAEACSLWGKELVETRMLQRMGVAGEEVDLIRNQLLGDFLKTAGPYLGRPDYPQRLLARRLADRVRPPGVRAAWPGREGS